MFQFGKYPMDILEMLSGHQAHQFKGLGFERQLQHQQQVQLQQQLQQQQQQQSEASVLSGLGLGSLPSSRSNAFADSSSIFAKMSAPPPPLPQQTQSSSSQSSRKSSKMSSSSSSGSSSSGYPQFLRPFHPAEAALAQEQLHSGMGRFDFGSGSSGSSSGVIGGVVTSAPPPPPPPLHPGLSVPQASPGPSSSSPSPSSSTSTSNNPASSSSTVASLGQPLVGSQSDARSLHQQFSCMLAANQYYLSGVPANASLEQFLVQQGTHNHLGLGLGQSAGESNSGLAPPPALHPSHSHGHPTPQPPQQQQQLPPHALSHPHSHAHPHHPLHPAPQPSSLGGFDFQGIPVLSSNQLASLMQQEAGLPLPLPLHLSVPKDEGKGESGSGAGGSGSSGSRRKKAMAGYLPQRKTDGSSSSSGSSSNPSCHSSSAGHGHNTTSGLVGGGGGVGLRGLSGDPSSILSSTPSSSSSSTVSSSSSSAPSSSSASVLVTNVSHQPKQPNNQPPMNPAPTRQEPEPLYHCGECGKSFTHLPSLRRHIRTHGEEGEVPTRGGSSSHRQADTSLPHSTQDGCSSGHHRDQSQSNNPDPTSSSCPSPERTYCCGDCGKGFKKRGHLLQHEVIHSGARPYACGICERSFNRRESLTRHEKIHEEKPFRCPACGRCFRESTSLLNHAASGTCGKPRRSRSSDGNSSVNSADGKSSGSGEYHSTQVGGGSGMNFGKNEGRSSGGMSCDGMYQQGRSGTSGSTPKTEGKYGSDYSRNRYQTSCRVDDYRRQQGNPSPCYSADGSCSSGMTGPALRKAPLAPTLHPHPQNQQQHHHHQQQQPHLPLSSLLDDSEDEVTSSAMSAIAAAAAASLPAELSNNEGREERRDIIGGLLGGLGFGSMGVSPSGPSSTSSEMNKSYRSGGSGSNQCMSGSTMPLSHPTQQSNQQNPNAKPKRPRKPRQKRELRPGEVVIKRRRRHPGVPRVEGEKPYLCNVCGRGFSRRETLRRHDRVHTGEKPFHCDICGKDFREPFHLTKHQTVHSGQKNFKCTLCGKEFGYAQSLKRHTKLHLKGDFRPRKSNTKSNNNNNAQNHGGVISQQGEQKNSSSSYYSYSNDNSQGSNVNTGNQPARLYTCEICWKSFRHHFHLTAHHQTVHENGGEKLFCCEVCGKAFAYSNSLARHRLSQHGLSQPSPNQLSVTGGSGSGTSSGGGGSASGGGNSSGGGGGSSVSESEAATNALLQLAPDNGSHPSQSSHSSLSHPQQPLPQPAGYSPLFYDPSPAPLNSGSSGSSQHHYSPGGHHSSQQQQQPPLGLKGEHVYQGSSSSILSPAPPLIPISSAQQQQSHHQQQHPFQLPPVRSPQRPAQQQGEAMPPKKKKKKKFSLISRGSLLGFMNHDNSKRYSLIRRKKRRLQKQLRRKKWILQQILHSRGGAEGAGTWRVGRLKFRGLRSLEIHLKRFTCPFCPTITFSRQAALLIHHAVYHPPRTTGRRARLHCPICGKRSRRLHSALRHRTFHLNQGCFSCPRCSIRFWNAALLERHRIACRRTRTPATGDWSLKLQMSPKRTVSEVQSQRSTVVTEYRH